MCSSKLDAVSEVVRLIDLQDPATAVSFSVRARRVRAPWLTGVPTYLPDLLCRTLSAASSGTLPSLAQDPPPKTLPFRHACPNFPRARKSRWT